MIVNHPLLSHEGFAAGIDLVHGVQLLQAESLITDLYSRFRGQRVVLFGALSNRLSVVVPALLHQALIVEFGSGKPSVVSDWQLGKGLAFFWIGVLGHLRVFERLLSSMELSAQFGIYLLVIVKVLLHLLLLFAAELQLLLNDLHIFALSLLNKGKSTTASSLRNSY